MKNTLKIFIVSTLLAFNYLILTGSVKAADLEISCTENKCSKSNDGPLFNPDDGLWYPDRSVSKIILLKNSSKVEQVITLKINQNEDDYLGKILHLSFVDNKTNQIVWEGDLNNFFKKQTLNLGSIKAGSTLEEKVTLKMDNTDSLDYQDKKTKFNLTFNFSGDKVVNIAKDNENQSLNQNKDKEKDEVRFADENKGSVLGQANDTTVPTNQRSWFSNLFQMIGEFFVRIFSFLPFFK